MDDVKIPAQESIYQACGPVFVVMSIVIVLVEILIRWHGFVISQRFLAVALLSNLVVTPLAFVRSQRNGRPLAGIKLLTFAYLSVLFTAILFEVRH